MATIASLWVKIGADIANFKKGMQTVSGDMQKAANEFSAVGRSMTTNVTLPILAVGGAAVKAGMDAVESENLFDVSMGKMAQSTRKWSEQLRKDLGLNAYGVRENVATFYSMFDAMKIGENASLQMSKGLTMLTYDMASFRNLKPEEAFIKLSAGIMGETEPLKRVGILVDENTTKTYAYANGIAEQGQELTQQQKVLARYLAIMDQTKKMQGDLARTIESPTNQLRLQIEEVKQITTEFGIGLLPTFTEFLRASKPVIQSLGDMVEKFNNLNPATQQTIIKAIAFTAAIGPLSLGISGVLKVGGGLLELLSFLTPSIGTAAKATDVATTAVKGLSMASRVLAAKVTLVVGALSLLVIGLKNAATGMGETADTGGALGFSFTNLSKNIAEATNRLKTVKEGTISNIEAQRKLAENMSEMKNRIREANTSLTVQGSVFNDLTGILDQYKNKVVETTKEVKKLQNTLPKVTEGASSSSVNAYYAMKAYNEGRVSLQDIADYFNNGKKFAMGTTLTRPTGLLDLTTGRPLGIAGEAGDEAIVPIRGGSNRRASERANGNMTVIIQMDGREVTRALLPYMPGELAKIGVKV